MKTTWIGNRLADGTTRITSTGDVSRNSSKVTHNSNRSSGSMINDIGGRVGWCLMFVLLTFASHHASAQTPIRGVNDYVYSIAVDAAGKVYAGGSFTQAGDKYAHGIAVWDPATRLWSPLYEINTPNLEGVNGTVNVIIFGGDGKVYVGGKFTVAGNQSVHNVASWDPATQIWSGLGGGVYDPIVPDPWSIVTGLGWNGVLWVGGTFSKAGTGVDVHNVALYNGSGAWFSLGDPGLTFVQNLKSFDRVFVMGRSDVKYFQDGTGWLSLDPTPDPNNAINGEVHDFLQGDGGYYLGGGFQFGPQVPGQPVNLAFFNGQTYSPVPNGGPVPVANNIDTLAFFNNYLLIAGDLYPFTIQEGQSAWYARGVAKLDRTTSTWSTIGGGQYNGVNGSAYALGVATTNVYVGGVFQQAGKDICAANIAVWDSVLNKWSALAPNAAPTVSITSPANGASYSAPANITINASAADDCLVAKVDFFQGSTLLGTATAAPYTFAWNNVQAGSYTLTAVATDNEGLTTTSAPKNITVSAGNDLIVDTITVDSAGNITAVNLTGGGTAVLNTFITKYPQSYLGGLFVRFVAPYTLNGFPAVYRRINAGTPTLVEVHGISGNALVVNNVVGLLWSGAYYTAQPLNVGPNGATGVNGAVKSLAIANYSNDLYLSGSFTSAGGFNYSAGIGVYRSSGGWQNLYIFSASGADTLSWTTSTKLRVSGAGLNQVNGPTYPYDHNSDYINVPSHVAYWNLNPGNYGFDGGYWSAN